MARFLPLGWILWDKGALLFLQPRSMTPNLFDNLADELILDILNHLHANFIDRVIPDLLQVSQCSQRLRRIALPILYRTVHLSQPKHLDPFLEVVIMCPTIYARLVKSLTIDWSRIPQELEKFKVQTVDLSQVARSCSLPAGFILDVNEGCSWANGLLLVHLLRNLEVLHIKPAAGQNISGFDYRFSEFLKQNLVSARLRALFWDAYQPLDIESFAPAFQLPSTTEIYINHPCSSKRAAFKGRKSYGTSNVELLELRNADISAEDLRELLQLPRALKEFIYSTAQERIYSSSNIRLDIFKQAFDCISRSVEVLDISWDGIIITPNISDCWSFRDFVFLKALYIEYRLIYGGDPQAVPCIANSMPPTLEVLAMRMSWRYRWQDYILVQKWRKLLIKKSATCLRRLRLIAHLDNVRLLIPLIELARGQGVKVALSGDSLS
jgi:hypothetical protein